MVDVSIGMTFGAAVDCRSVLYVWGDNSNGELGLGDYNPRPNPVVLSALEGKKLQQVVTGAQFCICLGGNVKKSNTSTVKQRYSIVEWRSEGSEEQFKRCRTDLEYMKAKVNGESGVSAGLQDENDHLSAQVSQLRDQGTSLKLESKELSEHRRIHQELEFRYEAKCNEYQALLSDFNQLRNDYSRLEEEAFNPNQSYEVTRLRQYINEIHREKEIIHIKNADLSEELHGIEHDQYSQSDAFTKLQGLREQNSKLKGDCFFQISDMEQKLEEERIKYKQLEQDLEICSSHNRRLEQALEEAEIRLVDSTSSLHMQFEGLQQKIQGKSQENHRLQAELDELRSSGIGLEQNCHSITLHNTHLKKNVEEISYELERLQTERNTQMNENTRLKYLNSDLEQKYSLILMGKQTLEQDISDLEIKNKELFEQLQRELTQRAKKYRDRTTNALNTPSRTRNLTEERSGRIYSPRISGRPVELRASPLTVKERRSPRFPASPNIESW